MDPLRWCCAFGLVIGHRAARAHVNYMTAVDDHPITCWTCHVYTQKDNFIARMMHETYVSPYNLAISAGRKQAVCGGTGIQPIGGGGSPGRKGAGENRGGGKTPYGYPQYDGHTAYVSNQWADNIYRSTWRNRRSPIPWWAAPVRPAW